jgi:three-Cys-motif partner protein
VVAPESPPFASDGLPARSTGPWVFDKKHYFERYLDIFSHAVHAKWGGKLCYLDMFSGPGKSMVRNSTDEVEGSPLLSLNYDFAQFVFVDVPDVLATLEKRVSGHPKRSKIKLIPGDCNKVINEILRAVLHPSELNIWGLRKLYSLPS